MGDTTFEMKHKFISNGVRELGKSSFVLIILRNTVIKKLEKPEIKIYCKVPK